MAWLWPGRGTVKPIWSNCSNAFLAIRNWTSQLGVANRICKDAFDWQTKGRAGGRPGLNSAWQPDVNGLAIQTQMAQRPRHQCQDLSQLRLLCKSLCSTTVNKNCSVLIGSLKPGLPRLGQSMLTRGVKAVRILPTLAVRMGRPSSVRRAPELLRGRALAKLWLPSTSKSLL